MWHMTCEMRHVTHDMWHVTRDMFGGMNILSKFQLPSSYCLWFMILWRSGGKGSLCKWINYEAVYRTAPATPGLLISSTQTYDWVPSRGVEFMTICGTQKWKNIRKVGIFLFLFIKRPARSGRSDVSSDAAASVITQGETD